MAGLRLYTSNRLEILTQRLAKVLDRPLASPLDKEVIVVQSSGMERWLSMQLAQRLGVCSNCSFPFPNAFIHEIFQRFFPDLPETSPFDPGTMTWVIMRLLPDCIEEPAFESLRAYLSGPGNDLKRFQLSERISDTLDQYLLFRPQMIFGWEQGQEEHWQAVLWRKIIREKGNQHRATLGKAFLEAVDEDFSMLERLPERISVFGISALPRLHMQIFSAISRSVQVNMFLMNPCREYWGDTLSEWEAGRATGRAGADIKIKDLHLEPGNSLLGSWGRLGRDFFDLVTEFPCEEVAWFDEPGPDNTLSCIQSDILNLNERRELGEKGRVEPGDASIQIHSCHSPMREIEVLQDLILQMFEQDPGLTPGDILVMTPDIEAYAPYIRSVFDLPADDPRRIPFSIADRSIRKEGEIIDAFLAILDLKGGRFKASQVLDVLESRPVRNRFGLSGTDLDLVRAWVSSTRIRWGIDGRNRAELGLPAFSENTWEAGLRRLLLGYAMPQKEGVLFKDILPYDNMEGDDPRVLGRFLEFTDQLFERVRSLDRVRNLRQWSETLMGFLDAFFLPDEGGEQEAQEIRRSLNLLGRMPAPEAAGFDGGVDLEVVRYHLSRCLEREGPGTGFIAGGITFCAILPMRSIPFKVICLMGMDNDAFPRQLPPLGFDLMAMKPEPGDRSRRNDDRYLFLETLLSARETFYISYVGQSIRDNSPVPPSVIVSELMDYILQGFDIQGSVDPGRLVTRHRLQAFSPEYFREEGGLSSFSVENFRAAGRLLETRTDPAPFISKGLLPPDDEWKTVSIDDLCGFFANPAKYLLERRLLIRLGTGSSILEENESFEVRSLERYLLEDTLLKRGLSKGGLKKLLPVMRAAGLLPHGTVGECVFEDLSRGVEGFVEKASTYMAGECLEPLELDVPISGFRLVGQIQGLYPGNLMQYRYSRVGPRDRLRLWIRHLALNCLGNGHYPRTSILAGLKGRGQEREWTAWEYSPVEDAMEILEGLLEQYWAGLSRPLHFFPRTSWEYSLKGLVKGRSSDNALESAHKTWIGNEYSPGECSDAYYQICFKDINPLDSDFMRVSEEVFRPLQKIQKEL